MLTCMNDGRAVVMTTEGGSRGSAVRNATSRFRKIRDLWQQIRAEDIRMVVGY